VFPARQELNLYCKAELLEIKKNKHNSSVSIWVTNVAFASSPGPGNTRQEIYSTEPLLRQNALPTDIHHHSAGKTQQIFTF
jgi:hypothetical protein